ncbi:MAG: NAD(+)/NADH kinase [Blastocatellia bacterium]|nr:NAD(+)/NADH kinase [Blastocatellia bacterium]
MADIAFRGIEKVSVELFDLEQATFTRTYQLQERYAERGDIWHVVGTDLIKDGKSGNSFIHKTWERGEYIWHNYKFVSITRRGIESDSRDLPPNSILIDLNIEGASTLIREKIFRRESITGLVTAEVEQYIERYGLYRGRIPNRATNYSMTDPRLLLVLDDQNEKAKVWASRLEKYAVDDRQNCIVVIGGDGTMLRAIRKYWRLRLPFFGINAGHLGFLLNNHQEIFEFGFPPEDLLLRQLPLLYVETIDPEGSSSQTLAFNDVWVERATSQAAWIEVKVNNQVRLPKLIGDGVLVATAAGSTAYARAMGAMPMLAETPAFLLVGSNILSPPNWKTVLLSFDSEVELQSLGGDKRSIKCYADGFLQGKVVNMKARISRIASAEVAFCASHDMAEKIAQLQFPKSPLTF